MQKKAEILLVEDNMADIRLAEEIFGESSVSFNLRVARNGDQALAMLRREADHADCARPDLVLLDLHLPGTTGREVLAAMKQNPTLRRIPVIVMSTSNAAHDVAGCYDLHANAFITKPADLDELIQLMEAITAFWLRFAEFPPAV